MLQTIADANFLLCTLTLSQGVQEFYVICTGITNLGFSGSVNTEIYM